MFVIRLGGRKGKECGFGRLVGCSTELQTPVIGILFCAIEGVFLHVFTGFWSFLD